MIKNIDNLNDLIKALSLRKLKTNKLYPYSEEEYTEHATNFIDGKLESVEEITNILEAFLLTNMIVVLKDALNKRHKFLNKTCPDNIVVIISNFIDSDNQQTNIGDKFRQYFQVTLLHFFNDTKVHYTLLPGRSSYQICVDLRDLILANSR